MHQIYPMDTVGAALDEVRGGLYQSTPSGPCCETAPSGPQCAPSTANPRQLIEDRISYHNRMSNGLWALLRSLPQDIPYVAAEAFASLILESRPK